MRTPRAQLRRRIWLIGIGALMALGPSVSAPASQAIELQPLVSEFDLVRGALTPPTEPAKPG